MSKKRGISGRVQKKSFNETHAQNSSAGTRPFFNGFQESGQYGYNNSKRNTWQVGGLPNTLRFEDFFNMYRRNGLARAGVMIPIETCWQTMPCIKDGEADKENETQFEKDLKVLIEEHDLFNKLIGLDRRQRVGRYGGIVIISKQANENSAIEPLEAVNINSLLRLIPVFESQIDVTETINDITSKNFGNPKSYNFQSNAVGARNNASFGINLHPSRVYAFGEGADDGSIYGVPALEAAFNSLLDWEKIRISSAEGYFKNAKQRLSLNINDETTASQFNNQQNQKAFDAKIKSFGYGWDTALITSGMDVTALQSSITDPTGSSNLCLQEICAGLSMPKTKLIGFEQGERSSVENNIGFDSNMKSRRTNTLTPMVKNFLWHLVDVGLLTRPDSGVICVEWDDLLSDSDAEKLDGAIKMADINQRSFASGNGPVFTPEEIREKAGFEDEGNDTDLPSSPFEDLMVDDDEEAE